VQAGPPWHVRQKLGGRDKRIVGFHGAAPYCQRLDSRSRRPGGHGDPDAPAWCDLVDLLNEVCASRHDAADQVGMPSEILIGDGMHDRIDAKYAGVGDGRAKRVAIE